MPTTGWNDIAASGRRASIAWTNTWERSKSGRRNLAVSRPKRRRTRMAETGNAPTSSTQRELVIERIFDAPRELVWRAWTDPERVMRWWGPKGFTAPACQVDIRVGGTYLWCMRSPEGQHLWSTGVY